MRHIFVAVRLYGNEHSPEWAAACATLLRLPNLKTVDFDIIPRMLPPHPPDDELMASILERLAPFEGQSPRSGVWSFRVFSVEGWRAAFEERGIPFIVKDANDPRANVVDYSHSPPTTCQAYPDHRQFILQKLNHATCPHGRDFPREDRRCCICLEDIHDNSTVAQVCPQSPKHIYHWLCMIQWLNKWSDENEEYNRTCPTCRAEMLLVQKSSFTHHEPFPPPTQHVLNRRDEIEDSWADLMTYRRALVSSSVGGYVLPPLDDNAVDRALPIRYAMMGDTGSSRELAVVLMALADPLQIEVMRSAAYMTEDYAQLDSLLYFADELRYGFETGSPLPSPQAARQPDSATDQMEAQHISGAEDSYATQEEGEELEEDEGKEGEDDDGDEEEASEGETLVDGSKDGQGDTEETDGEMTLLQETHDTDPEKPPSPEPDSQVEEEDSQMEEDDSQVEEQDSQMEEYDSEEYDSEDPSDDEEMSDPDEEDKSQEIFMSDAVDQMRDEESQGSSSPEWENVI
ncbi:hypothetical protein SLS55_010253 [Diplodia seriata]|uniref:RING-type domain-containing protein n=1 Tax=Diplodia seriata TaxID=420778 RepID=A0ABR3C0I6_9PEZI